MSRKALILETALALYAVHPWQWVTRERVAEAAEVSPALVSHLYGGMDGLRSAVILAAGVRRLSQIIARAALAGELSDLQAEAYRELIAKGVREWLNG